jgi:hypothetical protein
MPKGVPSKGFRMTKNKKMSLGLIKNTIDTLVQPESRFTINERFSFVGDMMKMLAEGNQASVIVSGPGGLGKTFNVLSALKKAGLNDITLLADFEVGSHINMSKSFRVIKGYSTPKGLYRLLYENRESIVVFDDTDSILKDTVSLNLLKAALDSYDKRIISWNADIRDDDLPTSFEFKGRVVFISNIPSIALDQAIISRSMVVDLSMSTQQKIDRMRFLISQNDFMTEYSKEAKQDALNFLESVQDKAKELTLRSLCQVVNIRTSNPRNSWKNLAEYVVCG